MAVDNTFTSTLELMIERVKYKIRAHPENGGTGENMIKDINFAEMHYYGKIDDNDVSVVPKEGMLVPTEMQDDSNEVMGNKFCLPFVSMMYTDMKENMEGAAQCGILKPTDEEVAKLSIKRAYESPHSGYVSYLRTMLIDFNDTLSNSAHVNKITNFNDYVKELMHYFRTLSGHTPVTFTGWNLSSFNPIFSTGLALSIKSHKYGDDIANMNFLELNSYDYYKKVAMNKGFSIVHQAPWILLADLGSPGITRFYDRDAFMYKSKVEDVFFTYYRTTQSSDIDLLKNNIFRFYNDFVSDNEFSRTTSVTCNNKTRIKFYQRNSINLINNKYRESNAWFKMYAELRNIENNFLISRKNLIQEIKNANKFLDNQSKTEYINSIFRADLFNKPWGYNYVVDRINNAGEERKRKELKGQDAPLTSQGGGGGGTGGGY